MKKKLKLLTLFFFSILFTTLISCKDDYEEYEDNYNNKIISFTIKDIRGRIIKGAEVYMFSEYNYADISENIPTSNILEYANEKQKANNSGVVVFEDLFSKLIEGDNTDVNRFTFIVVYSIDGEQKKQVHSELITKDYFNITGVIVCD